MLPPTQWTSDDLRKWRDRLRWTQAQASEALCFHIEAYKKLEAGTRSIIPRVRRLCLLSEREHVRALHSVSGGAGQRQIYATADRVLARIEALAQDCKVNRRSGSRRLRYVSLFSGIEGASAALERIGADALPVAFSEIDAAANAVLRFRWPDVPRVGCVMEFEWGALRGSVDVVFGGAPCQAFSVAGRRLGLRDPRGNLALHFLRAVDAIQPRFFLFENVPGLLAANHGEDFEIFLSEMEKLGYSCAWRILDARFFGLAQRRRRVWLVAERSRSGSGPRKILGLEEGESGSAYSRDSAWKASAGRSEARARVLIEEPDWSKKGSWYPSDETLPLDATRRAVPQGEIMAFQPVAGAKARSIGLSSTESPTLGSVSGGNRAPAILYAADLRHCTVGASAMTLQSGPMHGWSLNAIPCVVEADPDTAMILRRFTPLECLRLQGFDDDWLDDVRVSGRPLTDSDRYRLTGNAWPVPVAAWIIERLIAHLSSDAGGRQAE